jgi:hypothetical protein
LENPGLDWFALRTVVGRTYEQETASPLLMQFSQGCARLHFSLIDIRELEKIKLKSGERWNAGKLRVGEHLQGMQMTADA